MLRKLGFVLIGTLTIAAAVWLVRLVTLDRDEYMRRESADVRQRAVRPDSEFLAHRPVTRSRYSAETSWEFRTAEAWADYGGWVKARMPPQYKLIPGDGRKPGLSFTRALEADAQQVEIEALAEGPPAQVRITFRSYAY